MINTQQTEWSVNWLRHVPLPCFCCGFYCEFCALDLYLFWEKEILSLTSTHPNLQTFSKLKNGRSGRASLSSYDLSSAKTLQFNLGSGLPRSFQCLAGSLWLGPQWSLCTGWHSRWPWSCLVWGSALAGCGPHTHAAGHAPGPHC